MTTPTVHPHLLLAASFPPADDGPARFLGRLARHAPAGSLVVSTGAQEGADEVDEQLPSRIDRIGLSSRRLRTLPGVLVWSRHAAVLARAVGAEFTWCGSLKPCGYAARWVRERAGVPFGVLMHGNEFLRLRHAIHRSRLERRTARGLLGTASVVVANSRWGADLVLAVAEELGLPLTDGQVRVVAPGADPGAFRPGLDTSVVRERYGLGSGPLLLTVSRTASARGIETGVRALHALGEAGADARYAVVNGAGAHSELAAVVKDLGLAARVRFLHGVPDADLPALHAAASVYLEPSREAGFDLEGHGSGLLDAAASGVPAVAVRSGGTPDVVNAGVTGLLVDNDHPDELAAALLQLLADASLAGRLGAAGRQRVERQLNWARVVTELRALCHSLVR
jgi:phosphatidylinositol alpha-1,6-mannosyltransferase